MIRDEERSEPAPMDPPSDANGRLSHETASPISRTVHDPTLAWEKKQEGGKA
jgi:hypothetical protein